MTAPCCEPGCSVEVLCPVHQALSDLRAKVRLLDLSGTAAEIRGFHLAVGAVLALFEEKVSE